MAVVFVREKVKPKDLKVASEEFESYIKVVVDVETGNTTIGGVWHADGEKVLLENGSRQKNIWGGGIDTNSGRVETVALINVRPNDGNDSQEILDAKVRDKFVSIVKEKFGL